MARGRSSLAVQLITAVLAFHADAVIIACAGDSVTYGMHGQDKNDLPTTGGSWPAWLEHHLEKTQEYAPDHFTVLNLGRSGATAQRQTDRPYRETEEYEQLLASNFDLAIITLGTNDAKRAFWDEARYAAEYVALIDAVRAANPKGEIALGLPVARGVEINSRSSSKSTFGRAGAPEGQQGRVARQERHQRRRPEDREGSGRRGRRHAPRRLLRGAWWYRAGPGPAPTQSGIDERLAREIRSLRRYHDKIHPNDEGYKVLGEEALTVVAEFERSRLATAATSGPTPRPSTREPTVTPADEPVDDTPEEPVAEATQPTAKPTPRVVAPLPEDDTPPPKPTSSSSSSKSDGPPVAAAAALAVLAVIGIIGGYMCRNRILRRPPPPPSIDSPMEKGDKGAYALTALRSPPKPKCKNPLFMSPPPSERGPPPPPDGLRSRKSSDEPAQRLSFEEEEPTSPMHRPVVEEEDDAPLDDDDPRSPLTPRVPRPAERVPPPPPPDAGAEDPSLNTDDAPSPPPHESSSPEPARKSDVAGGILSPSTRDLWRKMTGRQ